MPDCPPGRHCELIVHGPFHPWWETGNGALVLVVALVCLAFLIAWLSHYKWQRESAKLNDDHLRRLYDASHQQEDDRVRAAVTRREAPGWPVPGDTQEMPAQP